MFSNSQMFRLLSAAHAQSILSAEVTLSAYRSQCVASDQEEPWVVWFVKRDVSTHIFDVCAEENMQVKNRFLVLRILGERWKAKIYCKPRSMPRIWFISMLVAQYK
jgi:hypothetical protein